MAIGTTNNLPIAKDGALALGCNCCGPTPYVACGDACALRVSIDGVSSALAECGPEAIEAALGPTVNQSLSPVNAVGCSKSNLEGWGYSGLSDSTIIGFSGSYPLSPPPLPNDLQNTYGIVSLRLGWVGSAYSAGALTRTYGVLKSFGVGGHTQPQPTGSPNQSTAFLQQYTAQIFAGVVCAQARTRSEAAGSFDPPFFEYVPANYLAASCPVCGGTVGRPQWYLTAAVALRTYNAQIFFTTGTDISQRTASSEPRHTSNNSFYDWRFLQSRDAIRMASLDCGSVLAPNQTPGILAKRPVGQQDAKTGCASLPDLHIDSAQVTVSTSSLSSGGTSLAPTFTNTVFTPGGSPVAPTLPWVSDVWSSSTIEFSTSFCCDPSNAESICNPLP